MKSIVLTATMVLLLGVPILLPQDKGFSAGIALGEPSGISGKLWFGNSNALDMADAWSLKGDDHLLFQKDYILH